MPEILLLSLGLKGEDCSHHQLSPPTERCWLWVGEMTLLSECPVARPPPRSLPSWRTWGPSPSWPPLQTLRWSGYRGPNQPSGGILVLMPHLLIQMLGLLPVLLTWMHELPLRAGPALSPLVLLVKMWEPMVAMETLYPGRPPPDSPFNTSILAPVQLPLLTYLTLPSWERGIYGHQPQLRSYLHW